MSNMMPRAGGPPMGGPPGGAPPGGAGQSVFNPTDMAGMKATGAMNENMTIGQFYEQMGIKWETPLKEAGAIIKQQMQGSTPLGKAQNMAGASPGGMAPGGPSPGGMPPSASPGSEPGLAGLIGR